MSKINDSALQNKKRIKEEIARIQYLTLYERLGVPENATNAKINEAYNNKSEICKTKPPVEGANDLYKLLTIAKNMLTDPASRQIYDAQMKGFSKGS